jgi:hypothetical protein
MTNQRGKDAAGISGTSMVDDGGCEDDDSKPSPMTSSSLIGLGPCQEVVQAKKQRHPPTFRSVGYVLSLNRTASYRIYIMNIELYH